MGDANLRCVLEVVGDGFAEYKDADLFDITHLCRQLMTFIDQHPQKEIVISKLKSIGFEWEE